MDLLTWQQIVYRSKGQRLREARKAAGISAEAMAEATDKSLSTIRNYEHDRNKLGAPKLVVEKYSELTGVPIEVLDANVPEMPDGPPDKGSGPRTLPKGNSNRITTSRPPLVLAAA